MEDSSPATPLATTGEGPTSSLLQVPPSAIGGGVGGTTVTGAASASGGRTRSVSSSRKFRSGDYSLPDSFRNPMDLLGLLPFKFEAEDVEMRSISDPTAEDCPSFFLFTREAVGFSPSTLDQAFRNPPASIPTILQQEEPWKDRRGNSLRPDILALFVRCYGGHVIRQEDARELQKYLLSAPIEELSVYQDKALHIFTGVFTYHQRPGAAKRMANFFSGGRKKDAPDSKPAIKVHSYELTFGRPLVVVAGEDAAGASKHRHVCQLAVGETFEEEIVFKIKGKGQSALLSVYPLSGGPPDSQFVEMEISPRQLEVKRKQKAHCNVRIRINKAGIQVQDILVVDVEGGARYFVRFSVESDPQVYGVDPSLLQMEEWKENIFVPKPLALLYAYLSDQGGFSEEFIFRLSSEAEATRVVKEKLNQGADVIEIPSVHIAANLIKIFFRELPVMCLPFAEGELSKLENASVEECVRMVHSLPKINHDMLIFLLDVMADVVHFQDRNKMNVHNLAVVTAPNLARIKTENPTLLVVCTKSLIHVTSLLIQWRYEELQRAESSASSSSNS